MVVILSVMVVPLRTAVAFTTRTTYHHHHRAVRQLGSRSNTKIFSSTDTTTTPLVHGRIPLDDQKSITLDIATMVRQTDLVKSHLQARQASTETLQALQQVAALQTDRVSLIQERDEALNKRKTFSAQVGKLMQNNSSGAEEEVAAAKQGSAQAANDAQQAETKLATIQATLDDLSLIHI